MFLCAPYNGAVFFKVYRKKLQLGKNFTRDYTVCIMNLDKFNLIWWLDHRPIFATALAALDKHNSLKK